MQPKSISFVNYHLSLSFHCENFNYIQSITRQLPITLSMFLPYNNALDYYVLVTDTYRTVQQVPHIMDVSSWSAALCNRLNLQLYVRAETCNNQGQYIHS